MKKIIIINQSCNFLTVDIANEFAKSYEQIILVTGSIKESDHKLNSKVKLIRTIKYKKSSKSKRLLTWLLSTINIYFILLLKNKNYKILYITNPPISYFTSLFFRNKFSVLVYDIYPDALTAVGLKNNHFIYRIWEKINKIVYNKAEKIYTLSEGMAKLLERYCSKEKIVVISNWVASDQLKPIAKSANPFIKEHKLENKFVIMYSGNIGLTHNVDTIIEIAIFFKNDKSIHFVIIGEGNKKKDLIEETRKFSLNNCLFLTWQPYEKLKYSLGAADLSVITLTNEAASVSVPSKTYNLLAVGSPLLCISPENSEISALMRKHNCGISYRNDEIQGMIDIIYKLKEDKNYHNELSKNALLASTNYTNENAKLYLL